MIKKCRIPGCLQVQHWGVRILVPCFIKETGNPTADYMAVMEDGLCDDHANDRPLSRKVTTYISLQEKLRIDHEIDKRGMCLNWNGTRIQFDQDTSLANHLKARLKMDGSEIVEQKDLKNLPYEINIEPFL